MWWLAFQLASYLLLLAGGLTVAVIAVDAIHSLITAQVHLLSHAAADAPAYDLGEVFE